jgi:hypothetical protein
VISAVPEVLLVDAVLRDGAQVSLDADQGQVVGNCYAPVIEEHMMIGT